MSHPWQSTRLRFLIDTYAIRTYDALPVGVATLRFLIDTYHAPPRAWLVDQPTESRHYTGPPLCIDATFLRYPFQKSLAFPKASGFWVGKGPVFFERNQEAKNAQFGVLSFFCFSIPCRSRRRWCSRAARGRAGTVAASKRCIKQLAVSERSRRHRSCTQAMNKTRGGQRARISVAARP